MKKLTPAEEEVMQWIWTLERCTVSDILDHLGEPRPPHSTISSIVRILEKKGFVDHKAYGRTHEYFPRVSRDDYRKKSLQQLVSDYFDGSVHRLVSYLVKEEQVDWDELQQLLDSLEGPEEQD
ncbi:MAG TPA: BlaI/MecI/CopY family transcriptional regulator [Saprospiraceae bacterium]|nr:BlaI/MecI/CopY family transcriptional regulator [Saprospiraceae bacterium]HPG07945.1 BlaI/MecI/CopY family transcriptional regulator [Saprospiraceae bacterium]HRV86275.1 BlaI/MecI/CopY family transcriptional regulator [Saprospiraceae bacterium]